MKTKRLFAVVAMCLPCGDPNLISFRSTDQRQRLGKFRLRSRVRALRCYQILMMPYQALQPSASFSTSVMGTTCCAPTEGKGT